MNPDREKWLQSGSEPPLDRQLRICDAHHHLWDRAGNRYMPEDLLKDIDGLGVVSTVFVDCSSGYRREGPTEMQPVGETEFVRRIAAKAGLPGSTGVQIAAGIVGFADLTLGSAVAPVLEAHLEAGKGYFKGIRHSSSWDPNPEIVSYRSPPRGLLLQTGFREGFACLRRYDLTFDAWLNFHQMPELADLAGLFPDTTIVLNHIGGPLGAGPYAGRRQETFDRWKSNIAALAERANVVVKVGGLGMTRSGFDWHQRSSPPGSSELAEKMRPYYLWTIERFGPDRCMFESNFPVDRESYSYTTMWNAFIRLTRDFSPDEKNALFYGTAARVYRLKDPFDRTDSRG